MESQFTLITIVLIIALYIPGYFFKRFYFQGKFAKQFGLGLFAERFITSIFWGIIIQLITFEIFETAFHPNIKTIWKTLSEFYTQLCQNKIPDIPNSDMNINYCLIYLLGSLVLSALLGWFFHQIVCLFKLHIKFPVFRFENEWHYYFNGLTGGGVSTINKNSKVVFTRMDVVVADGSPENLWYQGLLSHYSLSSKTGDLDLISLTEAQRWSKTDKKFKPIPGDSIILPYSKIININLRFITKKRKFALQSRGDYTDLLAKCFVALFFLIFFFSPLFIFYKRFIIIGFWRSVIATMLVWISSLFFASFVVIAFSDKKKPISNKAAVLFITAIVDLFFIYISYKVLN